jgi:hypothetical protein
MDKTNLKKKIQLGQDAGTAANRLKKKILFHYIKKAGENYCFQCGGEIQTEEELSIEHKTPWLDSDTPAELFYDMDNISFSHLSCNISAGRRKECICGTTCKYDKGCRCRECTNKNAERQRNKRNRKKPQ